MTQSERSAHEQPVATTDSKTSQPTRSKRKRLLFGIVALGLSTLVAGGIAEIGLRLFMEQEGKRLATYDSSLGWRGRPHGRGVYVREIDDIRIPFRYNNLGFRDEDVVPKKDGQKRVLMLGDSFIENLEVEYENTFPALTEKHLNGRNADWDLAAVGSQGYSTSQELIAYRNYRDEIAPDVVLLCFYCGNDYEDNLRRQFAYLDDDGKLCLPANADPAWKRSAKWLQRWLYESSHLVFVVKNALQNLTQIEISPSSKDAVDLGEDYKREITGKLVQQLDLEATENGSKFGVIVIPFRDDITEQNRSPSDFIVQFCAANGIPSLDLWNELQVEDFFETDIHFIVEGHQKTAAAIDRFIAEKFQD